MFQERLEDRRLLTIFDVLDPCAQFPDPNVGLAAISLTAVRSPALSEGTFWDGISTPAIELDLQNYRAIYNSLAEEQQTLLPDPDDVPFDVIGPIGIPLDTSIAWVGLPGTLNVNLADSWFQGDAEDVLFSIGVQALNPLGGAVLTHIDHFNGEVLFEGEHLWGFDKRAPGSVTRNIGNEIGKYQATVYADDFCHSLNDSRHDAQQAISFRIKDDDTSAPKFTSASFQDGAQLVFYDSDVRDLSWTVEDRDSGLQRVDARLGGQTRHGVMESVDLGKPFRNNGSLSTAGLALDVWHELTVTAWNDDNDRPGDRESTTRTAQVKIRDDDTEPPVILLTGPSGTIDDAAPQVFAWQIYDTASGVWRHDVVVTNSLGQRVNPSAPGMSGSFDLRPLPPGQYTITITATDNDFDQGRAADRASRTVSRTVTVVDDDLAAPVLQLTDARGVPLLGVGREESHGLGNAIAWIASDASGLEAVHVRVLQDGAPVLDQTTTDGQGLAVLDALGLGTFRLEITATEADDDGWEGDQRVASGSATLTITNAAPTVYAGGPYLLDEGGLLTLAAVGSDPDPGDAAQLVYRWDLDGDGQFDDAEGAEPTVTWDQWLAAGIADDGTYTIRVQAGDIYDAVATASATVTVLNAAPQVESIFAEPFIDENSTITATGRFSDPGPLDTHEVLVFWGDGTSSPAAVDAAARTFTATHHYADDRPSDTGYDDYVLRVEIVDDEGAVNPQRSRTLTVQTMTTGAIELPSFPLSLPADVSGLLQSASVFVDPQPTRTLNAPAQAEFHQHVLDYPPAGPLDLPPVTTTSASAAGPHAHNVAPPPQTISGASLSYFTQPTDLTYAMQPVWETQGLDDAFQHEHSVDVQFRTVTTFTYYPSPSPSASVSISNAGAESHNAGWITHRGDPGWAHYGEDDSRGFPFPDSPSGGGTHLFFGGYSDFSRLYQERALPSSMFAAIDQGVARADLSALMGGYFSQQDYSRIVLYWFDASHQLVGSSTLTGPTAGERGNQLTLIPRSGSYAVPKNARTVEFNLEFQRVSSGTRNDGYIDNIALQIRDVGARTYTETRTNWNAYTLPRFNPSLGSLSSASVQVDFPSATIASADGGDPFHSHAFDLDVGPFHFETDSLDASALVEHSHQVNLDSLTTEFSSEEALLAYFLQEQDVLLHQPAVQGSTALGHTHSLPQGSVPFLTVVDFTYDVSSTVVRVRNVDPVITSLTLPTSTTENGVVQLSGTFTDVGVEDTHRVLVDWGDGTTDLLAVAPGQYEFAASHLYADDDPSGTSGDLHAVQIRVEDDDGGAAVQSWDLFVNNLAPSLTLGAPLLVEEGAEFLLPEALFSDPGRLDTHSATIDWGDGDSGAAVVLEGPGAGVLSGAHVFRDEGSYPVRVTLRDDDTDEAVGAITATVVNAPPTISDLRVVGPVLEGAGLRLLATARDPGVDDVLTYTWDFGDGSASVAGVDLAEVSHAYPEQGVYTATLAIDDGDGGTVSRSLTVVVPALSEGVTFGGPAEVAEGGLYPLELTTQSALAEAAIAAWIVDWGDGQSDRYQDAGTKTHRYADGDSDHTIQVSLDKTAGGTTLVGLLPVTVRNVAPSIALLGGDSRGVEGGMLDFQAEATDPGDDVLTYTWDFGDGSAPASGPELRSQQHRFGDDGTYLVTLTVDDGQGGLAQRQWPVVIANVAPTIALIGDAAAVEGANYTLTLGAVTDPGSDRVVQWLVDWGDGRLDNYSQAGAVTHAYPDGPDGHVIQVALVDEDGRHDDAGRLAVTVLNAPPEIQAVQGDTLGYESQRFAFTAAVTDPAGPFDVLTFAWDFGDGSPSLTGINLRDVQHVYVDDGRYVVTLTVTDEDGQTDTARLDVSVANVAPTTVISGPPEPREGELYEVRFAPPLDPGDDQVALWIVDWGDGQSDSLVDPTAATHVYRDGPYSSEIVVTLVDDDGSHSRAGVLPVQVRNSPPQIDRLDGANTGTEGGVTMFEALAHDPAGDADPLTYIWDFGDGSPALSGVGLTQVQHVYADDGQYLLVLRVEDGDGGAASSGLQLEIDNVAPTLFLSTDSTVPEGALFELPLTGVSDPGADTVTNFLVDWGDGTTDNYTEAGVVTHRYPDGQQTHTIHVALVDEDGVHLDAGVHEVRVDNAPPLITSLSSGDSTAEGQPATFAVAATDPAGDADTLTYSWDFGDGSDPVSGAAADPVVHLFADDGVYLVTATVSDEDGGEVAVQFEHVVTNVAPVIVLGGDEGVGEAATFALTLGAIEDPGADSVSQWLVDWGDGLQEAYASGGVVTHSYADGPDELMILVSLVDEDGVHLAGQHELSVFNVSPVIDVLAGETGGAEGDTLSFSAGASDAAGGLDTLTYIWDFGDGSDPVSSVDLTAVSHLFQDDGEFAVTLSVRDEDGGFSVQSYPVSLLNVAPQFEAGADEQLLPPQAGEFSRAGIAFTDPGADVWSGTVDYQDGTGEHPLVVDQEARSFRLDHTFTISGVFDVVVTLSDDEGGSQTDTFQLVVVLNTPPVARPDDQSTDEDSPVTLDVLADNGHGADSDAENNLLPALTANLTSPSRGVLTHLEDGRFVFDPHGDFEYLGIGETATESFTYRVQDAFGETATATVALTIDGRNDAPGITSSLASVTVNEGDTAALSGVFHDVDVADDVVITASAGAITQDAGNSGGWSWSFDAADGPDQTQLITLTATDRAGASRSTAVQLIVDNVAPRFDAASQNARFEVVENAAHGTVVGVVAASDPGLDTLSYRITGGTGATAFSVDALGRILVSDATQLDYESVTRLTLELSVTDDEGATDRADVVVDLLNQASLSGTVFVDADQDGLFSANEMGLDAVPIDLLDAAGNLVASTTTGDGGFFLFEDLSPGDYQIRETQPSGVEDGPEQLGSLGGTIVANDILGLSLGRTDAVDYVFAELGQRASSGDTAGIGFWQNKHGQELITRGGAALADWLTANFANVFGDSLVGADGATVASFYRDQLFRQQSKNVAGPAKADAQFMALAMAVYFTNRALAGEVGALYGFRVTDTGVGSKLVDVGKRGAAFATADDSIRTVMQLLLATNSLTDSSGGIGGFAHTYDRNGDGLIDDDEAELRGWAHEVFSQLNEEGGQ